MLPLKVAGPRGACRAALSDRSVAQNHLAQHGAPPHREIREVVTAAAKDHQPALARCVRETAKRPRRMGMRCRSQPKIGKGIAAQAVGAALEQDELRSMTSQMVQDLLPRGKELAIAGAGHERQIEFRAGRFAGPGFVGVAGAGI